MSEIKNTAITEEQLEEIAGGCGITKNQAMKVLKYVGIPLASLGVAGAAAYGADQKWNEGKGWNAIKDATAAGFDKVESLFKGKGDASGDEGEPKD